MPKLAHSLQFTVNSRKVSVKREPIILNRKSAGFTLIELLIVITIIGILASLTLASFGGAQAKARDGVRKSDLSQIKRALELAKADCKGAAYYPNLGGTGTTAYNNLGTYLSDIDLKYISSAPKDPKDGTTDGSVTYGYGYATTSTTINVCPDASGNGTQTVLGASDYSIWARLERGSDADAVDSRTKCATGKPTPSGSGAWTDAAWAGYYVICNN